MARRLLRQAVRLSAAAIALALPAEGMYYHMSAGAVFPNPPNRIACYDRSYFGPEPVAPDPFLGRRPVRCGQFLGQAILGAPVDSLVPTHVVLDYFGQRLEYLLSGSP